jgi:hypothetical protein
MSKGLIRGIQRGSEALQSVVKKDIAVNIPAASLVITDGAPGFGTVVIAGLPSGNLLLHGIVLTAMTLTKGDTDIIDAFNGDFSLGTAPTADGVLAGAEIDLIPSTATVLGVGGVSSGNKGQSTPTEHGVIIDNVAGLLEVNLNMIIDDLSISADSSMAVVGTLHMAYTVLGSV